MKNNIELKTLMNRWISTGRIAFHYPRKKQVSLNGGKAISEKDAIKYLKDFFQSNVSAATQLY